ncbi:hypothetical protein LTR17_005255 [Elasticomyces elasticus]|nr:hypothetical protein LTR17_005255 [Elasticomyces elasticus]
MEQSPSLTTIAPELRNSIFELALQDIDEDVEVGSSGRVMKQPGLLAVCHQIRSETLPVFLDLVTRYAKRILISVYDLNFSTAMSFVDTLDRQQRERIGKNASLVLEVGLDGSRVYQEVMGENVLRWIHHIAAQLDGPLVEQLERNEASYVFRGTAAPDKSVFFGSLLSSLWNLEPDDEHGASMADVHGSRVPQVWLTIYKSCLSCKL